MLLDIATILRDNFVTHCTIITTIVSWPHTLAYPPPPYTVRALYRSAARMKEAGEPFVKEAAMCKLFTSQVSRAAPIDTQYKAYCIVLPANDLSAGALFLGLYTPAARHCRE